MKKLLAFLLLLPLLTVAQVTVPAYKQNTYVNDFADVLSEAQVKELNDSISSLEKKTSVQFAIVLLDKLPDDVAIEDYALTIGRQWHVGTAHNGLVYVAAIGERKQRLEVGSRLEGDLPDVTAKELTDNIKPFFRKKDYAGGLQNLVAEVTIRLDPAAKEQLALAAAERDKKKNGSDGVAFFLIILAVIPFLFGSFALFEWLARRQERKEEAEAKAAEEEYFAQQARLQQQAGYNYGGLNRMMQEPKQKPLDNYIPYVAPPTSDYTPPSSSSSSSSSDDSSSYGSWGGDSSSSTDSFSGGGSSNDW